MKHKAEPKTKPTHKVGSKPSSSSEKSAFQLSDLESVVNGVTYNLQKDLHGVLEGVEKPVEHVGDKVINAVESTVNKIKVDPDIAKEVDKVGHAAKQLLYYALKLVGNKTQQVTGGTFNLLDNTVDKALNMV